MSGTSLSLSAIRPSSGSEPAFIFCIARLRVYLHCGFGTADIVGNRLDGHGDLNHDLALPGAERGETCLQSGEVLLIFTVCTIAR